MGRRVDSGRALGAATAAAAGALLAKNEAGEMGVDNI